jgi:tetratricopeptide (TPR) repeat protein
LAQKLKTPPIIAGHGARNPLAASQARNRWLTPAVCLCLGFAVWAVFGQTLHHEFVNYDDDRGVYENPAITRGLSLAGVIWAFTHSLNDTWLPLTALSHMLDCQLYGLHPAGHHLTNVLLHMATVIALFLVLRNLTGATWRSAFVAAVFAIHPLRVESVAWVAERKDVLSGLFFMLTIGAYVHYARRPWSPVRYGSVLLLYGLGLMCKPMLVTLPLLLLLLDYWPLERAEPRRRLGLVLEKLPLLALSAAGCAATVLAQRAALQSVQAMDFPARISNALVACAAYLGQMVWPVGMAPFYPYPGRWSVGLVGSSVLLLGVISAGVLAGSRRRPWLLVGWLWYLGMLVPVIGFIQVGGAARADRYTYLPQIGLYLMVAWGAVDLCGVRPWPRVGLGCAAAAILAGLLAGARVQTTFWKDSVALWTRTLVCTSDNYMAHNNLGAALAGQGKLSQAVQQYQQTLALKPDYATAHNNLGLALVAQGNPAEAMEHYQRALQLEPDFAEAHNNLGSTLAGQGNLAGAIPCYERALQLKPDFAEARYNLGNTLARQGKLPEAVQQFEWALRLKPDYFKARYNLGNALAKQGESAEAIQQFERALQLKPDFAEAHNNLGNALTAKGRGSEAIQQFQQALQLKPDFVEAHCNLAGALAREGKLPAAIQQLQQAMNLATVQNQASIAEAIRRQIESYQLAVPPAPTR